MTKTTFKSIWGDLEVANVQKAEQPETNEDKDKAAKEAAAAKAKEAEEAAEEEEEEEEEETPAGEETPQGSEEENEEEEEYEYSEDDVNKAFTMLADENVLELTDDDDYDATPEGLADAIAATVRNKLNAEIAAIPPVVQDFYNHVMQGNDPTGFKVEAPITWAEVDRADEAMQKEALTQFWANQGMTADEIADELADVEARGTLEKKSNTAFNSLEKLQEKALEAKKAADKAAQEKVLKAQQDEIDTINKSIDEADEYAGFKMDDKRRQAFKDYLFKVQPRTGKTQMQMNMASDERKLRVAFLDFMDYNKEDLMNEAKTEVTKKRKKKLSRYTDKSAASSNSSVTVKKKAEQGKGKIKFPTIFGGQNIEVED